MQSASISVVIVSIIYGTEKNNVLQEKFDLMMNFDLSINLDLF